MKKFLSILLCMVLVLSFGSAVFADEELLTIMPLLEPILIAPAPVTGEKLIVPAPQSSVRNEALTGFDDYMEGEWYVDGLAFCVTYKLMNGTGGKTISPNKSITRAEVVTMIYRLADEPAFMNENIFKDVPAGSYYENAVVWAQGKGIAEGTSADKFSPNQKITREELITMLFNYVKYDMEQKGENTNLLYPNLALTYADTDKISAWATSAIRWAASKNILQGKYGNLVDPQGYATRAEAAAVFQRLGMTPSSAFAIADIPVGLIAGGWTEKTDNAQLDMTKVPEGAKEAFEKATAGLLGASYKPVAYLGSQVVAGTNYKFLCEVTTVTANPTTAVKLVVVNSPIGGDATIMSVTELNLKDLVSEEAEINFPEQGLLGGYYYGDAVGTTIDSKIASAFKSATSLDGAGYEPLVVLGSQVVAGANYVIVVKATRVTANPVSTIGVVKLYVGVDGTNQITFNGNLK